MNILYINGNGFDVNLGMETRYSDFYKYYKNVESKSPFINQLKASISKNIENWSDLELALGKYTNNIDSTEEFIEVFEDIGDRLAEYLQQQENNFELSKIDRQKLYSCLCFPERSLSKADENNILAFKKNWTSHWYVNVITFNYTKTFENILGKEQYNVIIGDHTNGKIVLKGVEHIHGYINARMVMGVNDITQIENNSFHGSQEILDALVKNNCNQAMKHTIDNLCKQKVISANLICIFGSSIGETDNMWWELIGNQLKRDCYLIIFSKDQEIPLRREYKKAGIERKIKEYFLNKTKLTKEEKSKVANNIFIGINSDMFRIFK